jgi:hypothetical protein
VSLIPVATSDCDLEHPWNIKASESRKEAIAASETMRRKGCPPIKAQSRDGLAYAIIAAFR